MASSPRWEISGDGLNVRLALHTPGAMAEGSWTAAPYLDERHAGRRGRW
jgi:hypothetical protein